MTGLVRGGACRSAVTVSLVVSIVCLRRLDPLHLADADEHQQAGQQHQEAEDDEVGQPSATGRARPGPRRARSARR